MKLNLVLGRETALKLTEEFKVKDTEPILIKFETEYDLSSAVITLQNKTVVDEFNFSKQFEVPDKFLFDGRLFITVEMKLVGQTVKKWTFTPIRIKQNNEEEILEFYDFLTDLEERIKKMEKIHEII